MVGASSNVVDLISKLYHSALKYFWSFLRSVLLAISNFEGVRNEAYALHTLPERGRSKIPELIKTRCGYIRKELDELNMAILVDPLDEWQHIKSGASEYSKMLYAQSIYS